MFRQHGAPTALKHPSITLASVFLETKTQGLSDHWTHAQIVPMNEMIVQAAGLPGTGIPIAGRIWKPFLRHMMAAVVRHAFRSFFRRGTMPAQGRERR